MIDTPWMNRRSESTCCRSLTVRGSTLLGDQCVERRVVELAEGPGEDAEDRPPRRPARGATPPRAGSARTRYDALRMRWRSKRSARTPPTTPSNAPPSIWPANVSDIAIAESVFGQDVQRHRDHHDAVAGLGEELCAHQPTQRSASQGNEDRVADAPEATGHPPWRSTGSVADMATNDMSVSALYRYPVKSMQGERLDAATVGPFGILGDRQWGLVDLDTGLMLTARREPQLLFAHARLDEATSQVRIELPDGSVAADDAALSAWLGRPIELRRRIPTTDVNYEIALADEDDDVGDTAPWVQWTGPRGSFHDSTQAQVSLIADGSMRGLGRPAIPPQRRRHRRGPLRRRVRRRAGPHRLGHVHRPEADRPLCHDDPSATGVGARRGSRARPQRAQDDQRRAGDPPGRRHAGRGHGHDDAR